jgi:hypothetical protein
VYRLLSLNDAPVVNTGFTSSRCVLASLATAVILGEPRQALVSIARKNTAGAPTWRGTGLDQGTESR